MFVTHNPEVVDALSSLNDKYVVVPADKASNNIILDVKIQYLQSLKKDLRINSKTGNPTIPRYQVSICWFQYIKNIFCLLFENLEKSIHTFNLGLIHWDFPMCSNGVE